MRVFQSKYDEAKPKQYGITLDTELKIALTPRDTFFFFFAVLSTHFQSKVSLEHQLPTATQVRKKRTNNEK